jgi:hypothetical protein
MPKKRKKSEQIPLPTLRIYCEGEKTEPIYLNGYLRSLPSQTRKTVVSVEATKKNTPVQLVEVAIAAKASPKSLPEDEFWVVYDRESTSKYPETLHAKAMDKAVGNGINTALSNVCFEYWLLLHFVETSAPYSSFEDLRKNSPLNDEVKKRCGVDYEKSTRDLFSKIQPDIVLARARGSKLNAAGVKSADLNKDRAYQVNPFVGMVLLLDAIDAFS